MVGRALVLATFPLSTRAGQLPGGIAGVRVERPATGEDTAVATGAAGGGSGGVGPAGGLVLDAAFYRVLRGEQVRGGGRGAVREGGRKGIKRGAAGVHPSYSPTCHNCGGGAPACLPSPPHMFSYKSGTALLLLPSPGSLVTPPPLPPSPQVVYQGPCTSLKRNKSDTDAVAAGLECGVVLGGGEFCAYQPGDMIECVRVVTRKQQ